MWSVGQRLTRTLHERCPLTTGSDQALHVGEAPLYTQCQAASVGGQVSRDTRANTAVIKQRMRSSSAARRLPIRRSVLAEVLQHPWERATALIKLITFGNNAPLLNAPVQTQDQLDPGSCNECRSQLVNHELQPDFSLARSPHGRTRSTGQPKHSSSTCASRPAGSS